MTSRAKATWFTAGAFLGVLVGYAASWATSGRPSWPLVAAGAAVGGLVALLSHRFTRLTGPALGLAFGALSGDAASLAHL
nr:hypothetical protein [Micromonospora sp. DSM 115978]